uniref:Uncharacterized protein n=1 Tax=Panagrolaimus sp. ES5 TaxID=591445 RepID=A0AC34GQ86_9BILA
MSKNTLSVHIAAYENSVEADSDDSNAGEIEGLKIKNEGKALIKKWEASKRVFTGNSLFIQNPFEFPRQQEDQNVDSEIMQFKASQHLLNPNEENLTDDEKDSDELSSVKATYVDQQKQQESDHREIEDDEYTTVELENSKGCVC